MVRLDATDWQRLAHSAKERAQSFKKFKGLEIAECPSVNLPEARSGRWGQGLRKATDRRVPWLRPVLVGQFEFLEWTADNHLLHSKFVGLCFEVRRPT